MTRFPHRPLDPGWGHPGWHDLLGWLLPTLFFLAFVALVVWAVLRLTGHERPSAATALMGPPGMRTDSALEHVRLRYARGEISREEFAQLSADLGAQAVDLKPPPDQAR
jgi:putative membrane protein